LNFRLGFITSWKRLELARVRKQRLTVKTVRIMIHKN